MSIAKSLTMSLSGFHIGRSRTLGFYGKRWHFLCADIATAWGTVASVRIHWTGLSTAQDGQRTDIRNEDHDGPTKLKRASNVCYSIYAARLVCARGVCRCAAVCETV